MNKINKNKKIYEFYCKTAPFILALLLGLISPTLAYTQTTEPQTSKPQVTAPQDTHTPALATEPSTTKPAAPKPVPSNHDVSKTIGGLLFTLGLLFALLWVLKKTGMGLQTRGRGFYRIVASSSLGAKEKICLLEIGDTWLVVGMTAHSMNTLHTLPAGSIDPTGPKQQVSGQAAEQFAKLLGHFKSKPKPQEQPQNPPKEPTS